MQSAEIKNLQKKIGYRFRNRVLLLEALTHPSYRHEHTEVSFDNQRLEFLGDAVLSLISANCLYAALPNSAEGDLSTTRSHLTQGDTLAQIANQLELGKAMRFGIGEEKNGGALRSSNLADALEALLGAIWLDGGIRGAERVFRNLFSTYINTLEELAHSQNPKGTLQELAQQKGWSLPHYQAEPIQGPQHQPVHSVTLTIENTLFKANASSRREAERQCALDALTYFSNLK
jgi:ribonuclease-3